MRRRRVVWAAVAVAGFLLMIGTAGSSDLNEISIMKTILQSLLGLGLFALGTYKGGFTK